MAKRGFFDRATSGVLADPAKDLSQGKVGKSFADAWQNSPGGQAASSIGDGGGKIAAAWRGIQGKNHDSHSADKAAAQMQANEDTQYGENQEYNKRLGAQDDKFQDMSRVNTDAYQQDLNTIRSEIQGSQKDAGKTYTNEIQPRLKDMMEKAKTNSAGAMSLQDAMDPNNAVATKTRALYAQQAQNENKASLANTGTLQALGMQNMSGQMSGMGPMTGGQLSAMMGANQAQTGAAYAKSQKRVQDLQDQGMQQGYDRSDKAYNQGLDAQDRYKNLVGDYEQASDRQLGRDANFRAQRGDESDRTYNLQQRMADTVRGVGAAKTQREMANYNTHMGGKQANLGSEISGINAKEAQQGQMITGGLQAGGTAVGAIYGGPAGAAAGNQAGQAAGNAMAPTATQVPQYGNYNPNGDQMGPPVSASNGYNEPSSNGLGLTGGGGFQANPYAYQNQRPQRGGNARGARA